METGCVKKWKIDPGSTSRSVPKCNPLFLVPRPTPPDIL